MGRLRAMAVVAGLGSAACYPHATAVLTDPSVKLAPICLDGVKLFTVFAKPATDFREVAILHSGGDWNDVTYTLIYLSMRRKAAALGANGVIIGSLREPTKGEKFRDVFNDQPAERMGAATAILIPADSERVRAACGAPK